MPMLVCLAYSSTLDPKLFQLLTFNTIIWYVAEPNLLQTGLKPTKSYTNNPCYPNCCDQADGTLISSRRRSMVAKLGRLLDF